MSSRKERGGVVSEVGGPTLHHQGGDATVARKSSNFKESRPRYYDKKPSLSPCGTRFSTPGKRAHVKGQTFARGHSDQRYRSQPKRELEYEDVVYLEKEYTGGQRKKSNPTALNHLLNFTLTPREAQSSRHALSSSRRHSKKTQCYNKENYLQANCQFIVRSGMDYAVHITDPDLLVDWDLVEQVRLLCHEMPSCPICLHTPTAAKITRCGHVYCSSCVLHYLTLSDKKWRKCPICYESIYRKDLKSVKALASSNYSNGDVITMTLMMRHKHSTIACPRSQWSGNDDELLAVGGGGCGHFAKLMQATPAQIQSDIIEKEKAVLLEQLKGLTIHEESERCFVEAALEDLRKREEELTTGPSNKDAVVQEDHCHGNKDDHHGNKDDHHGNKDDHHSDEEDKENESLLEELYDVNNSCSDAGSPPTNDYYYFYQASDGQHLYAHSLNTKCFLKEYGSWSNCPDTITATVLEMEQFTMTEERRDHYKYLGHLPLTCQFVFCELHLQSPLISQETLDEFSDQLYRRRQQRQRKKREERRRERKYERNDVGPVGVPSNATPEGFHDFLSMASSPPLSSPLSVPLEGVASTPPTRNHSDEVTMPSFAQALALGEQKTPIKTKSSSTSPVSVPVHSDSGEDGEPNIPSFQSSFSDALVAASQSVIAATHNHGGKPGGSKAAKKGRKKMVLFSTGGTRQL